MGLVRLLPQVKYLAGKGMHFLRQQIPKKGLQPAECVSFFLMVMVFLTSSDLTLSWFYSADLTLSWFNSFADI